MKAHLKVHHHKEYERLGFQSGPSSSSNSQNQQQSTSQQRITDVFEKLVPYAENSPTHKKLTDAVSRFICESMSPISVVEMPSFRSMIHSLDARYDLPKRKYFSKKAIPRLFTNSQEEVRSELDKARIFSITADGWTSSVNLNPYISLTIHFIDEDWVLRTRALETYYMPADHTGKNIAETLVEMLESWNINMKQISALTTDNGSNMVAAGALLQDVVRIPCFGHVLHNGVKKAVEECKQLDDSLGVAKKICAAFSYSSKRRRDLAAAQASMKLPIHQLITDCPTR